MSKDERTVTIGGLPYDATAMGVRPGVPPTSIWVAFEHPEAGEGRSAIVLIGMTEVIFAFMRKIGGRGQVVREPEGKPVVSVLPLGTCPVSRARLIIEQLAVPGSGTKQWARYYRRNLTGAQALDRFAPSIELASALVRVYMDECRRVLAMGDA